MKRFSYKSAKTLTEAVAILKAGRSAVLAGGTDILNVLKQGALAEPPETLVNVKEIPGLNDITDGAEGLKLGALVKIADIAASPVVKEKYAALAQAAATVAAPTLRNMGTLSGNICQEVQCWYFRRSHLTGTWFNCLRKGGNVCYAIAGDNRYHSVFGGLRVDGTPCSLNCPAKTDIASFMARVREGDVEGAALILLDYNPFPAITGRVCPHFCEGGCSRTDYDEAISIKYIERFVGDYILENAAGMVKSPLKENKKSVAVVGSGPAGLSTAYFLRRLGYRVTVFETTAIAGGTMALTIPNYRLPREILEKEIEFIRAAGVEIKTNTSIGKEITIPDLFGQGYQAVFVAVGAQEGLKLAIPGNDLEGTLVGLDFLRDVRMRRKVKVGKRVLVLGGGSVALDCARVALRSGAEEVHIACLESRKMMPADPDEIREGEAEGVVIHPSLTFTGVAGRGGRVSGVECLDVLGMNFDQEGRLEIETAPDSGQVIPADMVIFAIGQAPDLSVISGTKGLKITRHNTIDVEPDTLYTGVEGIFAGGDVATTAGSVIEAIACGRKAAMSINRYLGGSDEQAEEGAGKSVKGLVKVNSSSLKKTKRAKVPELPVAERIRSVDAEVVKGLGLSAVKAESNRCLNCGCVAVNSSDIAPVLIALDAKIQTTKGTVDAEDFFALAGSKTTVLDDDEIITGILVPAPKSGARQCFIKFAQRPTIDFANVTVAAVITTSGGKVKDARIVLGSVAPVPYRVTGAEAAIRGKPVSEALAEKASVAAVKDTVPLANNGYKVQIAQALVRRAILG